MGQLEFGKLSAAWAGEASDFTPLLAERLDQLGAAINVDLIAVGAAEVPVAGRRIDIVAEGADGTTFVIENQYGTADHDHFTRALAYAVAARSHGVVIVAESHRDEFRALAVYLNGLAERDPNGEGNPVWLVEARAARIGDSPWAPLFTAVVSPNEFTRAVEQAKQATVSGNITDFLAQFNNPRLAAAAEDLYAKWMAAGQRRYIGGGRLLLQCPGPGKSGVHAVLSVYPDGSAQVPFSSYAGGNSGIAIAGLINPQWRHSADILFATAPDAKQPRTIPGWLTPERVEPAMRFCLDVAAAYLDAKTNPDAIAISDHTGRSDMDEIGPSPGGAALG